MSESNMPISLAAFRKTRIAPVAISGESLVRRYHLPEAPRMPLVLSPAAERVNVVDWALSNQGALQRDLNIYGAILLREFGVQSVETFQQFIAATGTEPLSYTERSSPRRQVEGKIYTSTDHPPAEDIFLHNEQSYNLRFPTKIYFCCLKPPESGGETPIADCRRVLARLRPSTIESFAPGYCYVRNFNRGLGLSWQEAFQTNDPNDVERYCLANQIEFNWRGEALCTKQYRPTVARHPRTEESVWFNHLTFFNFGTLPARIQEVLSAECGMDIPNDTFRSNGSAIEKDILDELHAAYRAETIIFPWHKGDILFLDNMLVAHGRKAFTGERKVVVGMADLCDWGRVQILGER